MKATNHVIHTSDRNTFKACRQRWEFGSPLRQNWEPIRSAQALRFGTAIHAGLEAWYTPEKWGKNQPLPDMDGQAILAFKAAYPMPDDADDEALFQWEDELRLGIGMLDHYAQWAPEHDKFKPLYTEIPFEVPIDLPFEATYAGKIDLIVEDENGDIWVVDHKSTSRFDPTDWLAWDEQISSYCWAIQHMLGIPIKGFIYNELLKSVPHPPKVLKNGTLSVAKNQSTTYDLFLTEIRRLGYDVYPYLDILEHLRAQGNKFFRRTQVNRSPRELELLGKRIAVEAAEMLRPDLPIYPTPSRFNCGFCEFRSPCLATLDGSDFGPIMNDLYRKREDA